MLIDNSYIIFGGSCSIGAGNSYSICTDIKAYKSIQNICIGAETIIINGNVIYIHHHSAAGFYISDGAGNAGCATAGGVRRLIRCRDINSWSVNKRGINRFIRSNNLPRGIATNFEMHKKIGIVVNIIAIASDYTVKIIFKSPVYTMTYSNSKTFGDPITQLYSDIWGKGCAQIIAKLTMHGSFIFSIAICQNLINDFIFAQSRITTDSVIKIGIWRT